MNFSGINPRWHLDSQICFYFSNSSALPSESISLTVLPNGPLIQIKQAGCKQEERFCHVRGHGLHVVYLHILNVSPRSGYVWIKQSNGRDRHTLRSGWVAVRRPRYTPKERPMIPTLSAQTWGWSWSRRNAACPKNKNKTRYILKEEQNNQWTHI